MEKNYFVYITTNKTHRVLYTGVTSNLLQRIYYHRIGFYGGFSKKYNASKLVFYEHYRDVGFAIAREKQIKAGSRARKLKIINKMNPNWNDLWDEIQDS